MAYTISEILIDQLFKTNALSKRSFLAKAKAQVQDEDNDTSIGDMDQIMQEGHMQHEHGPRFRDRVLCILNEADGISQRTLSLILAIRPQSISELLSKLERDELIIRKPNKNDRREVLVYLTEKGRDRIKTFEEMQRSHAEDFLQVLNDEEKQQLSLILDKLISFNDPDGSI